MGMDEYSLRLYVHVMLEEARAAAARRALVPVPAPRVLPALRAGLAALRTRYVRWSSADGAAKRRSTMRATSR
jgi:hypothetical protein